MLIIKNILEFENELRLNDAQFTNKVGISAQTFSHWKKGASFSVFHITKIKEAYKNLDLNWLFTGEGNKFLQSDNIIVLEKNRSLTEKNSDQQKQIEILEYTIRTQRELIDQLKK